MPIYKETEGYCSSFDPVRIILNVNSVAGEHVLKVEWGTSEVIYFANPWRNIAWSNRDWQDLHDLGLVKFSSKLHQIGNELFLFSGDVPYYNTSNYSQYYSITQMDIEKTFGKDSKEYKVLTNFGILVNVG